MSQLHSDMLAVATLAKDNLIFAMAWDAKTGRKGEGEFTMALAAVANWLVQFQANRIPKNQVFPMWLNATQKASQVYDEWYTRARGEMK